MKITLILAAVIPALLLLIQVYRADRLEKEPIPMLLGLVLCGIISAELASLSEQAGVLLLERFLVPSIHLEGASAAFSETCIETAVTSSLMFNLHPSFKWA